MANEAKKTTKPRQSAQVQDATTLLRVDHQRVSRLFAAYEKTPTTARKKQLVAEICNELALHAQVEEEIFYPEVKRALNDQVLVPEATVEHASLKALMVQIDGVEPDGEMFDAKIKVLAEYVSHHVKEEQEQIFPKARASDLDLVALGTRLAERKAEILAQRA